MKKKLIISTVAMTVMLGFNKLSFADNINNNQTYNQQLSNHGYINATKVNFREGASTNSKIYKVLDKDTDLIILAQEGDWTKVDIDNTIGYVYGKYVTSDNTDATSLDVCATAYCGDTITSTGTTPKVGTTIAVDPDVIPYGSKVYIPQFDKVFTAEDCGSAIKGNKIDIFMEDEDSCNDWGVQNITIYILN